MGCRSYLSPNILIAAYQFPMFGGFMAIKGCRTHFVHYFYHVHEVDAQCGGHVRFSFHFQNMFQISL
jgi:hypothetical protein